MFCSICKSGHTRIHFGCGVAQIFLEAQYFHHCRIAGAKEMARPLLPQCSEQDLSSLAKKNHYSVMQYLNLNIIFMLSYYWYITPKQIGHMEASSRSLHLPQVISLGHPLRWVSIHRTGSQKWLDLTRIANSARSSQSLVHHKLSPTYCGVPWWYHDGDMSNIFRADPSKRWSKCHWFVTCN